MRYKSCHLIEHGISIDVNSIKACCLSREFNKGMLMIEYEFENSKIDWEHLFFVKRHHRTHQKNGRDLPACEGCYNLREEDWDDEDYISFINFDHWSECNSHCIYCAVRKMKPRTRNNAFFAVKELIKQGKFRNNGEITFQGGEPTILKEFDSLLKLFLEQGCKIRIHSSGILFNRTIRNALKKGVVSIVISPDSARNGTYFRIKRVDKADDVWKNIAHYRRGLKDDKAKLVRVKYIIIPGINDNLEEVTEFLNKIKKLDIKSVIVDFEYTYANQNKGNIAPHIFILNDYIEHFCQENDIEFSLYDSALYAERERTFEKTQDFSLRALQTKINNYKYKHQA